MVGCDSGALRQQMLERSVIASVIAGDVLPSQLALTKEDFTGEITGRLFAVLTRMEAERREIDLAGVCMADETIDAGAIVDLAQERCVSVTIAYQNCALLRETTARRALSAALEMALGHLKSGGGVLEEVERLKKTMDALGKENHAQGEGRTMLTLLCELLDAMETKEEEQEKPIACGIEKLDRSLMGGFRPGDLCIVAALTGVGKSAMLSFMMRNAAEQGKKILLVSCEMSDTQNAERFLASISGVDIGRFIRRETLTEEENLRVSDGMTLYHPENIRVISSGTQAVSSIRRAALAMKMTEGLDLIVVDYLQRLRTERGAGSRADEIGAIASGLKSLAVDLNVPVLTAAQFNREAAKGRREALGQQNAGIPALHQLRDSSQIEDEANAVIILDEPERGAFDKVRRINAYIAKNRSGGLGAVHLLFHPSTMTFTLAPEETKKMNFSS